MGRAAGFAVRLVHGCRRVRAAGRVRGAPALCALLLAGCALRSDVNRVEAQLLASQQARARADSAVAANLASIARLVQGLYDSLAAQQELLTRLRGDVRVELLNVQQQLVAIQELTGQSQQRLTELRGQLEERLQSVAPAGAPAPGGAPVVTPLAPAPGTAATRPTR